MYYRTLIRWIGVALTGLLVTTLISAPAQAAATSRSETTLKANFASTALRAVAQVQSTVFAFTASADDVRPVHELLVLDQEGLDKQKPGTTYKVSLDGKIVYAKFVRGTKYSSVKGHDGPVWVGYWSYGGKLYLCIAYILHNPDGTTSTVTTVKGEKMKGVALIANDIRSGDSNRTAECHGWAAWLRIGGKPVNVGYNSLKKSGRLTKGVASCTSKLLARSRLHGPYKMSVSYGKPTLGETGKATITVKASNGRPASSKAFTATKLTDDVRIVKAPSRLDANGKAVVTYKVIALTEERSRIQGCVSESSSFKALLTNPSSGRQKLMGGGFKERKCVSFGWRAKLDVKAQVKCLENCFGQGTIVNEVCAPDGTALRLFNEGSNGVNRHQDVARGTCATPQWQFPDDSDVEVLVCTLDGVDGRCTSSKIVMAKLHVVCPAWAQVGVTVVQGCELCKYVQLLGAGPADSSRFYTVWWILPDGSRRQMDVSTDGVIVDKTVDIDAKPGDTVRMGFDAYSDSARTKKLVTKEFEPITIG